MRKRFITWCILTGAIFLAVILLLPLKFAANHFFAGVPWPDVSNLDLPKLRFFFGGLFLGAGLISFFVVLANVIWPGKFPLREKFARKDD
ncbi:hypothetical protein FAZ95_00185 [Trinickia violacea]|uniref:Uncharacterized protein n=1 Tax=Trinickia violacea TaxID=2571746 RepID=A0A4P8ILS9_9BURK|nr:hypothetical protein [Trinickia violacea]QCP47734.1 hypothetical protein FAZ95_00185 [Trinickia violacea]